MNIYKYIVLGIMLTFGACGVDEYDQTTTISTNVDDPEIIIINDMMGRAISSAINNGQQIGCITVKYPFEVITTDSLKYTILTNAEFDTLVNNIKNPIVDFVYPVLMIDQLGIEHTVYNLWDLASYFAGCFPDSLSTSNDFFQAYVINFDNSCYELKYPIDLFNEKGKTFTISKEDDLIVKLAEESVYFKFPFALITQDGIKREVESSEDLEAALIACNGTFADSLFNCLSCFDYLACYKLIYPLQINILQQSTPYTVQDAAQMSKIYVQGRFLDFAYPLTVQKQDSQLVVLHNSDELMSAILDCNLTGDLYLLMVGTSLISQPPCYDIVFPIIATKPSGLTRQFENLMEVQPLLQDSTLLEYKLQYPIDVRILDNNQVRKLSKFLDIQDLLAECDG